MNTRCAWAGGTEFMRKNRSFRQAHPFIIAALTILTTDLPFFFFPGRFVVLYVGFVHTGWLQKST